MFWKGSKDWNERRENGVLLILLITLFIHIHSFETRCAISLRIFLEQAITHPSPAPATISSLYIPVQARRYTTKLIRSCNGFARISMVFLIKKFQPTNALLQPLCPRMRVSSNFCSQRKKRGGGGEIPRVFQKVGALLESGITIYILLKLSNE